MRFSAILNLISASKGRTRGRIYQQHIAQKDTSNLLILYKAKFAVLKTYKRNVISMQKFYMLNVVVRTCIITLQTFEANEY